jgi:hypothetical protein
MILKINAPLWHRFTFVGGADPPAEDAHAHSLSEIVEPIS